MSRVEETVKGTRAPFSAMRGMVRVMSVEAISGCPPVMRLRAVWYVKWANLLMGQMVSVWASRVLTSLRMSLKKPRLTIRIFL